MPFLLAAGVAHPIAPQERRLTEGELKRLDSVHYDKAEKSGKREELGTFRGGRLVADYPCGDICPAYTVRIIHYAVDPGPACQALGGVADLRGYASGISPTSSAFCVPRPLSITQPAASKVCGISIVSRTYGGVAISFADGRWFMLTHLGVTKGYLVGPRKEGDLFKAKTHPTLNAYLGDRGWTQHTILDDCHMEVVSNGNDLGLQLTSRYDASGSRMRPIETRQFLEAEPNDSAAP